MKRLIWLWVLLGGSAMVSLGSVYNGESYFQQRRLFKNAFLLFQIVPLYRDCTNRLISMHRHPVDEPSV